jgi:hypothetical protein
MHDKLQAFLKLLEVRIVGSAGGYWSTAQVTSNDTMHDKLQAFLKLLEVRIIGSAGGYWSTAQVTSNCTMHDKLQAFLKLLEVRIIGSAGGYWSTAQVLCSMHYEKLYLRCDMRSYDSVAFQREAMTPCATGSAGPNHKAIL